MGDSITDGPENFRRQLMERLDGDHCRYDMVGSRQDAAEDRRAGRDPDHEGHAGWQANMLADEAREWAQATQPDLVTVAAGVNDFYQTSDTPQQAAEDVLRLLRELRAGAPGAALLVGQIHPGGGIESEVAELNRLLAERAQRETPGPLTLVDLASGFNVDAYTVDGVHPNAAGAVVLAERWYRALRPLLPCG
ncbi:MAG: GDSL-type esterase/lipase family protein [Acidimicrobiales bacterium]